MKINGKELSDITEEQAQEIMDKGIAELQKTMVKYPDITGEALGYKIIEYWNNLAGQNYTNDIQKLRKAKQYPVKK